MGLLYHHLHLFISLVSFLVLTGISLTQANMLIRYPIHAVQTASRVIPDQVAPGLSWDFLSPSYQGGLDYGSPNGFLQDRAPGGYLGSKWSSSATPNENHYFEFSIQPRERCIAQLEGISMALLSTARTYKDKRALSPQDWEVRLSLSSTPGKTWTVFREPTHTQADSSYTIHLFQEAGSFSKIPLIPGGSTATLRIYGFNASPLDREKDNLSTMHAVGGLIHTDFKDSMLGQDLILHGTIYCKEETHKLLKSINIGNPLLKSVKQDNSISLALTDLSSTSISMIPEPHATGWAIGLLCLAATRLSKYRKHIKINKIQK